MSALQLKINCEGERGFALHLDCRLPARGITAIYGPSGSGKSTLLDCVAGLRTPSAGSEIRFGDTCWHDDAHTVPPWQRRVGYVFQDARLFPHLNVEDNLLYGARRATTAASAWCCSPVSVLRTMVATPSVPVATRACAVMAAISMRTACPG